MILPFFDLAELHASQKRDLEVAFQRVISSNHFILGQEVEAFENEYAIFSGAEHCIAVGNGLDALYLTLASYDISRGDEVIVPAHTYIATWLAISRSDATIVPVEPLEGTYNINPKAIEAAITANTVAIMPVHLYGQPAEMDLVNEIAERKGLLVIADAAQSQGAKYKGRALSDCSHAAATSFYPGKNLGALGDGGAVTTNDSALADKIRYLRNYGSQKKYRHEYKGINSRLDELQAAFLRLKLRKLDEWNDQRRVLAKFYCDELSAVEGVMLPEVVEGAEPVWHQFVIRCQNRELLQEVLESNAIATQVHYPIPPHMSNAYSGEWSEGDFPLTEKLANEVLSLPMFPGASTNYKAEIKKMIELIRTHQA